MTVNEALREVIRRLREAEVPGAEVDARYLVAAAAGVPRDRLSLHLSDPLGDGPLWDMVEARRARQPVAQIIGQRQFYGRSFVVTPQVLDPRPETEMLIEAALAEPYEMVLDLGTGSGAILLTLVSEMPGVRGVGVDVSNAALEVADRNARALGVWDRVQLIRSDWWDKVEGQFDLIVANPPYISADEMAELAPEVRDYEPRVALTDEGDGLGAYRVILGQIWAHLVPEGRCVVEIGAGQGSAVAGLFTAAGMLDVAVLQDLAGHDRVVCGRAGHAVV